MSSIPIDTSGKCKAGQPGELELTLLPFTKMQALGNDFVVISEQDLARIGTETKAFEDWASAADRVARTLCDRHFGVGADGLIVVRPPDRADCQIGWRYINSDGSPSNMCGNGLRCLALWAVERRLVAPPQFAVSTDAGKVAVRFAGADEITIDLGEPLLDSRSIPVAGPDRRPVLREPIIAGETRLFGTCVSVGNPHCVIIDPQVPVEEFGRVAGIIQALPLFPEGVNVEFAFVKDRTRVKVLVWERGCGATLACASGAAATLVAAVLEERLEPRATIELPGGELLVDWSEPDRHVRLTGPARQSFNGAVDVMRLLKEAGV